MRQPVGDGRKRSWAGNGRAGQGNVATALTGTTTIHGSIQGEKEELGNRKKKTGSSSKPEAELEKKKKRRKEKPNTEK